MLVKDIPGLIKYFEVNLNSLKDANSLNSFDIGYEFENERIGTDGAKEYDLNIHIKAEPIKKVEKIDIEFVIIPTGTEFDYKTEKQKQIIETISNREFKCNFDEGDKVIIDKSIFEFYPLEEFTRNFDKIGIVTKRYHGDLSCIMGTNAFVDVEFDNETLKYKMSWYFLKIEE